MRGPAAMRLGHCGNDGRSLTSGRAVGMACGPAFRQRTGNKRSWAAAALMREAVPPECCRRQFKTENGKNGAGHFFALLYEGFKAGPCRKTACENNG